LYLYGIFDVNPGSCDEVVLFVQNCSKWLQ